MKIDFRKIESGLRDYTFDVGPEELVFDYTDVIFNDNIKAVIHTFPSEDKIIISGTGSTTAGGECFRCLKPINIHLEVNIKLVIQRVEGAGDYDTGDDDFVIIPKSQAEYNLAPHFRELFLMALPSKILCDPNCKGLCPYCGTDLNVNRCSCKPPDDSGYWDDLGKLLNRNR